VYFISGEDTTSVLCGFTITGGYSGIECHSGMKIINNKISGNSYYAGGGIQIGINSGQSRIVIEKNIISNNIATPVRDTPGRGGGIYMNRTNGSLDGRISNNFISQNIALTSGGGYGGRGGGIYIRNCSPLISNNIIVNNTLEGEGGGVYLNESNSLILNNLITNNEAGNGGGIYIEHAQPIFINNSITNNTGSYGSGICLGEYSNPIIINSILWNDTTEIDFIPFSSPSSVTISHSDIQGGQTGMIPGEEDTVYWLVGNIDVYPEFVDTTNGDYHLSDSSACIGVGIDSIEIGSIWYYCPVTDLEGNPRPNPPGTMPDMGAYENGPLVGIEDDLLQIPKEYSLAQNYPNPFNSTSVIRYSVPQLSQVQIKVFDVLGNEIETLVDEHKQTGTYELTWYAENLPSGVYFCRLKAGSFVETKKMVLMK